MSMEAPDPTVADKPVIAPYRTALDFVSLEKTIQR
jgi:hypothetical protein